ncbi:MAG: hypothetical protein Q4P36_03985 [Bowdeniella nasicola]|nr:hypothetical protein [Bowdeniella nasicola]
MTPLRPDHSRPDDEALTTAVTLERVVDVLHETDLYFFTDRNLELGMYWDGAITSIHLLGHKSCVLFLASRSTRTYPLTALDVARGTIREWHRVQPWPRGHYSILEDGSLRLHADVSIDATMGLGDGQLLSALLSGVEALRAFFTALEAACRIGEAGQ